MKSPADMWRGMQSTTKRNATARRTAMGLAALWMRTEPAAGSFLPARQGVRAAGF